MYFIAGMTADLTGYWEKAADYHKTSEGIIVDGAEKAKAAYAKNREKLETSKKQLEERLAELDGKIKALEAKGQENWTNDDYTEAEPIYFFRGELGFIQNYLDSFDQKLEGINKAVAYYHPEQSRAAYALEKIRLQKQEIDTYKGGRGDKVKWVEGVVNGYTQYMKNYENQDDKIALAYRLMVLSPDSKTAPVLLEVLKGNATDADLKRAIQSQRPPAKKK
jgi:DNA-binding transcriptional MerR regulator